MESYLSTSSKIVETKDQKVDCYKVDKILVIHSFVSVPMVAASPTNSVICFAH